MSTPESEVAPRWVHVGPPSVVRTRPFRALPDDRKLLVWPTAPMRVALPEMVGSNSRRLMEKSGPTSGSGIQVGLALGALSVFQTPPFTVPTKSLVASPGAGRMASIAPDTGLGWAPMPSVMPPKAGAGPSEMKFGAPNGTAGGREGGPPAIDPGTRKAGGGPAP